MIITIGSVKGGVGKSTIITNLAVLGSLDGKKVLMVDADDQASSTEWVAQRNELGVSSVWISVRLSGTALRTELIKMKNDYDLILIDSGGRDTKSLRSALTISNVFVVPFKPSSLDLWTAVQVDQMVGEAKIINPDLKAVTFVNFAVARGPDVADSQALLKESSELTLIPMTVGHRKSFQNATAEGLAVCELKPQDRKAVSEIKELYKYIVSL